MFSISRCVLRWGLIGAVGLGALAFLAGPDRISAGFAQLKATVESAADEFVDDPVALRHQLQQLSEKYPARIAEVRGELAEIASQKSQLERHREVASRVVTMTTNDLRELQYALAQNQADHAAGRTVSIRVSGRSIDFAAAKDEAHRIAAIRRTYKDRFAGDDTQVEFLEQQDQRLRAILQTLEDESARYEAKLWQLDRQIDAIARNERLIEMTEEQQALLAEYDKFGEVGSLDQIESKLAELRTVQEAQLQTLANRGVRSEYETRAREGLMDHELDLDDPFQDLDPHDSTPHEAPLAYANP